MVNGNMADVDLLSNQTNKFCIVQKPCIIVLHDVHVCMSY